MQKLERKHIIGLSLISLLVFIKYAILPIFDWQAERIESLNQKQTLFAKQQGLVESIDAMKAANSTYQSQLSAWEQQFYSAPTESEFPPLVANQIQTLAEDNAITLVRSSWGDVTEGNIASINMRLVIKGSFAKTVSFLNDLESLDKVFIVESAYYTYNIRKSGEVNLLLSVVAFSTIGGKPS